jgi:signal transduction histidine kinase
MMKGEKPEKRMDPGPIRGLSGKVLALTIVFVMLGEVLIFVPSIANFRLQWLKGRVAQAEIAALAAEAAPDQILSRDLRSKILKGAGVQVVSLTRGDRRQLMLRSDEDAMVDASFDLREIAWPRAIVDALRAMAESENRIIRIIDKPPNMSGDLIEVVLDEAPLRSSMFGFGINILLLSIFLSLLVASLVFGALNRVLVRPMQRLTRNMVAFGRDPEDVSRIVAASDRRDEIGLAEQELRGMQQQLNSLLKQKSRLADLGLAVSKVSHDLRNMLSSAHLISDRLAMIDDPTVRRFAPRLIESLDRAIEFLTQTLKYGSAQELPPSRARFPLRELVDEVFEAAVIRASRRIILFNNVPQALVANADRSQLSRVLTNLLRNAIQAVETRFRDGEEAGDGSVTVRSWREGSVVMIEVKDNGPGVPEAIRERLFEPFQSASRPGGTGLGLAISFELIKAHGGTIALESTTAAGTSLLITLPDSVSELRAGRRGEQRAGEA